MTKKPIPRPAAMKGYKDEILQQLALIDRNADATSRILGMENEFRTRIGAHVAEEAARTSFKKMGTSPFVLLALAMERGYRGVRQLEGDLKTAKCFSNYETSLGKMIEQVALPVYGWSTVPSAMHTSYSVIDGERMEASKAIFLTLKSGPSCLNDDSGGKISDSVVDNYLDWAADKGLAEIDFTVGILYGTFKKSNKKDWHIINNAFNKIVNRGGQAISSPDHSMTCTTLENGVRLNLNVKVGIDLWHYIGGSDKTYLEILISMIRACVNTISAEEGNGGGTFTLSDLAEVCSLDVVPNGYNASILQRPQWEWLFMTAYHYFDELLAVNPSNAAGSQTTLDSP